MLYLSIAFQIIAFVSLLITDTPANSKIENNREGYIYYLKNVEGEVTQETDEYFTKHADAFTAMESEFQTIYQKVSEGKLTKEESKSRISELKEELERKEGFLVLYDQYTEAKLARNNRYLLNTNAWDSLLSGESLDFLLIIFIMIIGCVSFGMEITSEMDVMLRISLNGEKKIGIYKLSIVVLISSLSFVLQQSIRILYYHIRYGFSHGEYPLQSLCKFQTYDGEISLLQASIGIFAWKLLGVILWSVLVCACMLWLRQYTVVMISAFSGIIMSYVGISKEYLKYFIPGPLGALLGTGFYRGSEYSVSDFGEQKIYSFIQLSRNVKMLIFVADILILICLVVYVINKYSNCWNRWKMHKIRKMVGVFLAVVLLGTTTGCSSENKDYSPVFNLKNSGNYESSKYLLYYDINQGEGAIVVRDKISGKTTNLIKDVYRDGKEILNTFYVDDNCAYYIEMTYSKEEKYFANELDKLSLIRVDLEDFSAKPIFSVDIKTTKKDLFGINEVKNENCSIFNSIVSFFVYENEFCFVTPDGEVYDVNLSTGTKKLLFLCNPISVSFVNGSFYYIDEVSRLTKYDIESGTEQVYEDIATSDFIINENYIVYKDVANSNALVCAELSGANKKLIYEGEMYFLAMDKNAIYYMDDDEVLHEVDFKGKNIKETQTTLCATIYVFSDYDKILFNIHGEELKEIPKY